MKKNENNYLDLMERMRNLYDELRTELLTDHVTLKQNKLHLNIPYVERFEIQDELFENEEIKPIREEWTTHTILDYNEFYLSIPTNITHVISDRIRQICNKHGYDFGTMIIFTDPPYHNPELTNTLLIKLVDINKSLI